MRSGWLVRNGNRRMGCLLNKGRNSVLNSWE